MNIKGIAQVLLILPVILVLSGCTSRTSNYNFGIKISEQPGYFSDHYGDRNPKRYAPYFKNINVYRDTLNIDLNHNYNYPINIEFLVDAIDYDIRVYPAIDSKKYLLTTMEIGFADRVQIKQKITVDGEALEHEAKYICVYDKEKDYYVPKPVAEDEYLTNEKKYRVVFVYKFSKGNYFKDFRHTWFKSGNLKVEFKVKDKEELDEELDFKLYWYRRSSLWERIATIT
jgi:hypothetical protein